MPAEKVEIVTDNGTKVKAIAPVIVSASRSTDIPAYFPKWFVSRFNGGRGYVKWFNPFNQKPVYVSFEKTKVIVFWSKNPKPFIPYLPQLDAAGVHYYFQFTLNDYHQENLEPNVPSVESRIRTFKKLASVIGPERVVWRFDPVLFTKALTPREVATRIFKISKKSLKAAPIDWYLVSLTSSRTKRFKETSLSILSILLLNTIQLLLRMLNPQPNKLKNLQDTFRRFVLIGRSAAGTWKFASALRNLICLITEYCRVNALMLSSCSSFSVMIRQ